MPEATITECLSEIKVLDRRIAKKQQTVSRFLTRPEHLRDPLEKEGGSVAYVRQELQAIRDLEENKVRIRRAIQTANDVTEITVGGSTRTISNWLVWKRDVLPGRQSFLGVVLSTINVARQTAVKTGGKTTADATDAKPGDIIVNVSESELASAIEELEAQVESLDGQFSLKNATTVVSW